MSPALIVIHADGEDRYEQSEDRFEINGDGLLEVSREYQQEITEEAISDLAPGLKAQYRQRLGEFEASRAPIAYYAPGHWHRVRIERDQP